MNKIFKSSIGRKIAMALSGLFLVVFLLQHFIINFTSVIDPKIFNAFSHFMGTNPLVQFVLQPILIVGVLFHFIMAWAQTICNIFPAVSRYSRNKKDNLLFRRRWGRLGMGKKAVLRVHGISRPRVRKWEGSRHCCAHISRDQLQLEDLLEETDEVQEVGA